MLSIKSFSRILSGILFGTFISIMIWAAMDRGFYFSSFNMRWQFNELFYDNWFLRIIVIVVSSGIGAIVAGVIARKNGIIAGLMSILLPVLFWLYCFYCLLNHQFNMNIPSKYGNFNNIIPQSTSSIMLIIAALINIVVGYFGGRIGKDIGIQCSKEFDLKKHSLFGIKWYNYLWYPIVLYIILVLSFILASSYLDMLKLYKQFANSSIFNIIFIDLIGIIALICFVLMSISIFGSFILLKDDEISKKQKILQLILAIIILPLISLGLTFLSNYIDSFIQY